MTDTRPAMQTHSRHETVLLKCEEGEHKEKGGGAKEEREGKRELVCQAQVGCISSN